MPTSVALTTIGAAPVTGISEAHRINDSGQVVGQEDLSFPFIWTPNTPNGTTGASQRLPVVPLPPSIPTDSTIARGINNNGDVVGQMDALDPAGSPVVRAVLWPSGSGTVVELGTLIPSIAPLGFFLGNSRAFAINDAGVIVGVSDSATGVEHAFVFDPAVGVMRDLGSLIPFTMLPGTADPSAAFDVNAQGDIVGEATAVDASGNLVTRAFLVPGGGLFFMQDLGTLLPDPANPGRFLGDSSATSINNARAIVGESDAGLPGATATTPAFFNPGAPPFAFLPAVGSAQDVNKDNTIVGFLGVIGSGLPPTSGFQFSTAFSATDLTTLVAVSGTTIVNGTAMNAMGQIAANANNGASTIAVLITP